MNRQSITLNDGNEIIFHYTNNWDYYEIFTYTDDIKYHHDIRNDYNKHIFTRNFKNYPNLLNDININKTKLIKSSDWSYKLDLCMNLEDQHVKIYFNSIYLKLDDNVFQLKSELDYFKGCSKTYETIRKENMELQQYILKLEESIEHNKEIIEDNILNEILCSPKNKQFYFGISNKRKKLDENNYKLLLDDFHKYIFPNNKILIRDKEINFFTEYFYEIYKLYHDILEDKTKEQIIRKQESENLINRYKYIKKYIRIIRYNSDKNELLLNYYNNLYQIKVISIRPMYNLKLFFDNFIE